MFLAYLVHIVQIYLYIVHLFCIFIACILHVFCIFLHISHLQFLTSNLKPPDRGSKGSAADSRPFLSGIMISVTMARTCLQSES